MPVLYVTEMDVVLRKDHEVLVVSRGGEALSRVPLPQVEQVVLLGPVSVSTQVLTYFLINGVDCVFCSANGKYFGRLVAGDSSFGALRIAQMKHVAEPERRQEVAKRFVIGKTRNHTTLLRRQARKRGDEVLHDAVARLEKLQGNMSRARDVGELRGFEGEATRTYFQAFRRILREPMGFVVRARRPPPDPINSMLSLGYSLLAEASRSALHTAGLDPFLGYLHTVERSRPSLALDMMEEFRPPIVESVVLRLVNTSAVRPEHFQAHGGGGAVRLTPEGLRVFVKAYEERMQTLVLHPMVGRVPYRRTLDWQARRLAWLIQKRVPAYEAFTPR